VILYLDTSALVKLLADEDGSQAVVNAATQAALLACHVITYAEARAALAKKQRMGELSAGDARLSVNSLDRIWSGLKRINPDEAMVRRAGDLAERLGLRGYDSVHLAAAESMASVFGEAVDFRFAVFDQQLASAAKALGLRTLPA